ncbi:MAG TPA: hypothetical protein VFV72_02580 [Candidatus Limnocylindrales bacterium]|nr:hypothetical protein [Candidatus Limnocylindrales bacterium]
MATERRRRSVRDRFEMAVEASRLGAVFASNLKAYRAWRRTADRQAGRKTSLSPEALEATIRHLASTNPEYVVMG